MKMTGVINVRYQPWTSGSFGQQLKESWASFYTHLRDSGRLMEFFRLIAFDAGQDPDLIENPEEWLEQAVSQYLQVVFNYANSLAMPMLQYCWPVG